MTVTKIFHPTARILGRIQKEEMIPKVVFTLWKWSGSNDPWFLGGNVSYSCTNFRYEDIDQASLRMKGNVVVFGLIKFLIMIPCVHLSVHQEVHHFRFPHHRPEAVFRVRRWLRSNGLDHTYNLGFVGTNFHIHEQIMAIWFNQADLPTAYSVIIS